MNIGQTGQYNHIRCIQRGEWVASHLNDAKFISDVISIVYLLNKSYKPFYKWMHRGLKKLPFLGNIIYGLLHDMVDINGTEGDMAVMSRKKIGIMSKICNQITNALRTQGLSDSDSEFLLDHGPVVQNKIKNAQVRCMNVWAE